MVQATLPNPPTQEIVITARALPDSVSERAYSVVVIDALRLANSPSSQLDQIVKDVPGLQLFRRSDARSGHPTSQGVTLRALGGNAASRALLVLDGIPQSDPFGGWVNWPAYDPAGIGEVRIVRGGGSVADGSGALAGSIEMTSRLGDRLDVEFDAGSRESFEGRTLVGMSAGGGNLVLSGRGARGDGFTPVTEGTRGSADRPAPYKEGSLRGIWLVPIGSNTDLQISGLAFADRRDRGVNFTGNRTDGADVGARFVGKGEWKWSVLAYGQWRELRSSFASVSADRSTATRVSLQDSVPSHAFGASFELRPPIGSAFELRVGGDFRRAHGESRELFTYVAGQPTRRRKAGGDSLAAGLFSELTADVGKLTLGAGGRIDRWQIFEGELVEWVIATRAPLRNDQYPKRSGWRPTARAGGVLDAGKGLTVRSAAYLGWRLPTLNELFRPFRAGPDATAANPLLDPEKLAGGEVGARYSRDGLTVSVTAFANRLSNAIANVTLGNGPGVFPGVGFVGSGGVYRQRQNLDAVRVRGIEASAELKRGDLAANVGASLTDARVQANGVASPLDGLRPAQTPRFAVSAGLSWDHQGQSIAVQIRHVGSQFEDDLNSQKLSPATTVDAFAAWPIGKGFQLVARGENLLNELVMAGIGGDGTVERATPRTLWIGLRFIR